jgi:hypothetical protein
MLLVAEEDRLDWGAVLEVERQDVQERNDGGKSDSRGNQPAYEPRYSHLLLPFFIAFPLALFAEWCLSVHGTLPSLPELQ